MTDEEIDEWNAAVDENKKQAAARQDAFDKSLLGKLRMPEDQKIMRKLKLSHASLLAQKGFEDAFEYDPVKRDAKAKAVADKNRARIRLMRPVTLKRRKDETVMTHQRRINERNEKAARLAMEYVPGAPVPRSPALTVPRSSRPRTPSSPLSEQEV